MGEHVCPMKNRPWRAEEMNSKRAFSRSPTSESKRSDSSFSIETTPTDKRLKTHLDGFLSPASTRSTASATRSNSTTPTHETKENIDPDTTRGVPVTPLTNIQYIHGGYAGAAPHLVKDEKWMLLLQHLMPDEHLTLSNYLQQAYNDNEEPDPLKVMKWGENNPVVAAYGVVHSQKVKQMGEQMEMKSKSTSSDGIHVHDNNYMLDLANTKRSALAQVVNSRNKRPLKSTKKAIYPAIEWDVFVDPTIVYSVNYAIQKMEDLMNITNREVHEEEVISANIEVDRQVMRLINRMMLAHGSATQLLIEAVGVATRYNFSRVMKSDRFRRKNSGKKNGGMCGCNDNLYGERPRSPHDGHFTAPSCERKKYAKSATDVKNSAIFVDRWLSLFASSLKLGKGSLESIRFLLEKKKIRTNKLSRNSKSFRERTSQLLRSSFSQSFDEESSTSGYTLPDVPDENEMKNPPLCGLFLCLGMSDPNSLNADHDCSRIAENTAIIRKILGENLRLVLDMKSRHVPARVWGRVIDNLRSRNLDIEGIGSFDIDELRQIETRTSTPVTTIFFFHSAGDLQRAIHAHEIKRGDTVYFNAGSLLKKKRTAVCESNNCWSGSEYPALTTILSDIHNYEFELFSFQPYAYPTNAFEHDEDIKECKASLADYQKYFDLNIGLYVQEFSIGSEELDVITRLVNKYPSIYNCGLAWGGLNGVATPGVKGDGLWSQRYVGRNWTFNAAPTNNMTLIAVEDHHAVQKVIMYGSCGQVTTVNHILDEDDNIMCQNPNVLGYTQTGNINIL